MNSEHAKLISQMKTWTAEGWLRAIDLALVQFISDLAPDCDSRALLAAALASHQLGRGHIYLDLARTLSQPEDALSMPPEGDDNSAGLALPSSLLAGLTVQDWRHLLQQSDITDAGPGERPLVLDGDRLYLRRYWQYEQQVAAAIRARLLVSEDNSDGLGQVLTELFLPLRDAQEQEGSSIHWQTIAAALAVRSPFTIISGGPGTGKTTTVVRLLGVLQQQALETGRRPLRIHLAAPTGKAAARLTESIGAAVGQLPQKLQAQIPLTVTTLHRLLQPRPFSRKFRHNARNPLHLDLLVVDEASMVDLELMAALLEALHPKTRLILLGDKDQLASVEAGAVLGELCRYADQAGYTPALNAWLRHHTGYDLSHWQGDHGAIGNHIALLRKSHRFHASSGIGRLATAVNRQDSSLALGLLQQKQFADIAWIEPHRGATLPDNLLTHLALEGGAEHFPGAGTHGSVPKGYGHYLGLIRQRSAGAESFDSWTRAVLAAFGQFQVLTAVRKGPYGVEGLNLQIEKLLRSHHLIGGTGLWYAGRPVLVTHNDYSLGLMNGDVGIALPDPEVEGHLRVCFQMADGSIRRVLPSRLSGVETVFAMTVHKSQGSEFSHTCLVLPDRSSPILTKELLYTGITRARDWFSLVVPNKRVLRDGIERRTLRASALAERLEPAAQSREKG